MGIKYLCLNILRAFKQKKLQVCAIASIICLSSFLYTMMSYALESLTNGVEILVDVTNQEDFSVMMVDALMPQELQYLPEDKQMLYSTYGLSELKRVDYSVYEGVLRARQKAFEKVYPNHTLELRRYRDVDYKYQSESHTMRVFKPAQVINLTYVKEGRMPQGTNEIAVNEVYAKKNGLTIGDTLEMNEHTYTITGWVLFSDMNFLLFGDDFIMDNKKLGVGVVSDRAYERIRDQEALYYAGKIQHEDERATFKEKVIDTRKEHGSLDFIVDIVSTENQMRSGGIHEELKSSRAATLGICVFISGIAIMLVGILVGKLLKNERIQIGVLKALGYMPREIALGYVSLLLMLAIPMTFVGYALGKIAAEPLKRFYLEFYLLLDLPITDSISVLLTAVILPVVLIVGISFYMIAKMLSKPTLQLMKVGEDEKIPWLFKWVSKRMRHLNVQTKFKYTFIYKNTSKFIVFFWGILFSAMLILMSLMMMDFFEKMTVEQYTQVDYVYEGLLDPTKPKPKLKQQQEKFLVASNGFYEGEAIGLRGLEPDNVLYQLYDKKQQSLTKMLDEGVIINQSFHVMYDTQVGDYIILELGDKSYSVQVVGVAKGYGQETVYTSLEALSQMMSEGKTKRLFSGVYSTERLNEKMYLAITNKYDMIEQTEMMQGFIKIAIYGMVGSAIFISAIILYVLTTMTVEDNYYNISLLKVMGYNKKEVGSMLLDSYFIYALLTYVISIPVTLLSVGAMVQYFSQSFGMVLPLEMTIGHCVIGFIIVITIFEMGTIAAKRRIQKVSLQEVLKAYRE